VAIGASTGGPPVLSEILRALPRNFDTPIVVVQHMTAGFTRDFARWLAETAQRRTLLVDSPLSLEAGAIYLAADDSHLVVVSRTKLAPERSAARGFQRPSVDVLFESAAAVFGAATIGVLLTGMGRDGVEGMMTLKRKGALTIVQTPSTCAVDAMPRAAIERDAVDMVASPGEIASLISSKISSTPARVCGEKR
jgi:two-component system chemotaxis response regulator CheB